MIYYTSDLHLGNSNIIEHENRPFSCVEQMDEKLVARWNGRVLADDDVYVLGDFCFKGASKSINFLERLNGYIHLLTGNHDSFLEQQSFKDYLQIYAEGDSKPWVTYEGAYKKIKDGNHEVVLCHYPLLYWENMEEGSIHLYGHVHTYRDCSKMAPNSYNVGVDANNYLPRTLEELVRRHHG